MHPSKKLNLHNPHWVRKKLDVENRLVASYETEMYNMERAIDLLELYDVQILKTEQAIDLLYSAYSNSGKDFEEVLRMEQQLLKYNISQATATKDYFVAVAKLDYITAKSL